MSKFGNYEALKPLNKPRRFDFIGLAPLGQPEPFMMVLPCDELNPAFMNLAIERAADPATPKIEKGTMDAAALEFHRDLDMAIMSKTCVTAWGNVCDQDGNKVAFSDSEVLEFFQAIPRKEFDRLKAFCRDLSNFTVASARAAGDDWGKPVPRGSSGNSARKKKATASSQA